MRKIYLLFFVLLSMTWPVMGQNIALITNKSDVSALPSEQHIYDALTSWGYTVTVIEDDEVNNGTADFSTVDAIVVSEVASSGKLVPLHTVYKFPKPVVNLKGFMMRYDKWGWTINPDPSTYANAGDYPTFLEDRESCGMGTQDMEILTADHYITQDFTSGQAITWSTAPCDLAKTPFAYGYDLQQVSGAIALTKNMSMNMPEGYNSIYAIPAGSEIKGAVDTITTENRIVVIGAHNFALANEEGDDDPPGKSYMTEDFLKLFERSVEWALYGDEGPSSGGPKVALITNRADVSKLPSEQHIYDALTGWGYDVVVVEDDEVNNEVADFSGVDAIVVSEVASSGKLVKLHTFYKFPKPVVNLKGFMMRYDKWGWTINPDPATYTNAGDYPTFLEDRESCGMGTQDMEILMADHYITQDFTSGQAITWSTAPCDLAKTPFAYGYDLQQVSGAIALTKNMSMNMPEGYNSIYAVPAGSEIKGAVDTITTENRIVIIGAHNFALANEEGDDDPPGKSYMTEDFLKLFERSMEWAIYGDAGKPGKETLALITNRADVSKLPSEQHIYDALTGWGYDVVVVEDDEVNNEVADFSGVDAIVVSEVASSGKLVKLHTFYKFPKPVVNLKGFMMRYDKWGWTINPDPATYTNAGDYPTFLEDRESCGMGTQDMEILTADHYITQDFTSGQAITWSTAPCDLAKTPFAYGYDLQQVSGAIALTKNMSMNMPEGYNSIYAVPAGSEIKGAVDTITTENRIVIIGAHNFALANEEGDDDPPGKSYMTEDFLKLFQRSVEWALSKEGGETEEKILYVGAKGPDEMVASDSVSIAKLEAAGFTITLVDDDDVKDGYDYSAYAAVVYGESCSSSKVLAFGNTDNYPVPCVMLEPLAVRHDKWNWVLLGDNTVDKTNGYKYPGFTEDRSCATGTTQLKILDNTHYITNVFEAEEIVDWSTAICGDPETIFAVGFDLNQNMSGAIPLAKNNSSAITDPFLWAAPKGTVLPDGSQLKNRLVTFGIHELGIYGKDDDKTEYATDDFYTLLIRSLDWVLGAGPSTSSPQIKMENEVLVYPNPATHNARFRFTLHKSSAVTLSLINMLGQRTDICKNQSFFEGVNEIEVNTQNLKGGLYIYLLEMGNTVKRGKLQIAK